MDIVYKNLLCKPTQLFSFWLMIGLALFPVFNVQAQEAVANGYPPLSINDKTVQMIAEEARERSLPQASYEDGKQVGVETEDEKKKPILSFETTKDVVNDSVFWTTVYWCGLDIGNMDLSQWQDKKLWDEKQRAYIAVLHGTTHGLIMEQLKNIAGCSDDFKEYLMVNYGDKLK